MPFLDRAIEFLGHVDLEKTRLLKPRSSVFVCGGKIDEDPTKGHSVRDLLLKGLPDRTKIEDISIVLAEKAKEALAESHFDNLLDMEECIAFIVDAVLLIVESPGSVCELGSFTKTDEIRKKLVAIIPSELANLPSFITLGPVKFIEGKNDGGIVEPVHWENTASGVHIDDIARSSIVDECRIQAQSNFARRELISLDNVGHQIFAVLGVCHLLRGPKLGEIKKSLEAIGLTLSEDVIRKYLDTLEVCGFLKVVRYTRKRIHYVPRTERIVLDFGFKTGTPDGDRNALRWIDRIKEDIEAEEPERLDIFQEHNDAA